MLDVEDLLNICVAINPIVYKAKMYSGASCECPLQTNSQTAKLSRSMSILFFGVKTVLLSFLFNQNSAIRSNSTLKFSILKTIESTRFLHIFNVRLKSFQLY